MINFVVLSGNFSASKQQKEKEKEAYAAATMSEANPQWRKQDGDQKLAADFTARRHFQWRRFTNAQTALRIYSRNILMKKKQKLNEGVTEISDPTI